MNSICDYPDQSIVVQGKDGLDEIIDSVFDPRHGYALAQDDRGVFTKIPRNTASVWSYDGQKSQLGVFDMSRGRRYDNHYFYSDSLAIKYSFYGYDLTEALYPFIYQRRRNFMRKIGIEDKFIESIVSTRLSQVVRLEQPVKIFKKPGGQTSTPKIRSLKTRTIILALVALTAFLLIVVVALILIGRAYKKKQMQKAYDDKYSPDASVLEDGTLDASINTNVV